MAQPFSICWRHIELAKPRLCFRPIATNPPLKLTQNFNFNFSQISAMWIHFLRKSQEGVYFGLISNFYCKNNTYIYHAYFIRINKINGNEQNKKKIQFSFKNIIYYNESSKYKYLQKKIFYFIFFSKLQNIYFFII